MYCGRVAILAPRGGNFLNRTRQLAAVTSFLCASLLGVGAADAAALQHVPHGVPIPGYSKLLHVTSTDHEDAYVVSVRNEKSAYVFWMSALPKAGFVVNTKESSSDQGQGQIWFSGHGCREPGTLINIYKNRAVINLEVD